MPAYVATTFSRPDNSTYPAVNTGQIGQLQGAVETLSTLNAGSQPQSQAIAYAASITPDASLGVVCVLAALTGAVTIAAPINMVAGNHLVFAIPQGGAGSMIVTWNAAFHFTANSAPTLTTAAGKVDVVGFFFDGVVWREQFRSLNQA